MLLYSIKLAAQTSNYNTVGINLNTYFILLLFFAWKTVRFPSVFWLNRVPEPMKDFMLEYIFETIFCLSKCKNHVVWKFIILSHLSQVVYRNRKILTIWKQKTNWCKYVSLFTTGVIEMVYLNVSVLRHNALSYSLNRISPL